ncbi:MAG: DUF4349 domain-containing protein [Bacillota bacterium]|nr:DUF4349 domain-containing protein [Bacillota bacterium]
MKKVIITLLVVLLAVSAFYGCSATSMDKSSPSATTTYAGYEPGGAKDNDDDLGGDPQVERKIIRNATLDIEATDVVTAYESLLTWAAQYGGYETRRNQQRVNDIISIDAQIKIKPEHLDALLDYAKTLGDVINTQISTEDITDSYYDIQTRLHSMELSLESYYGYLAKAKTIDESLSVQSQINQLTVEIESLKGRLKLWDSLLAESVVTIRLRQTNDPVKIKKEIDWSTLSFADMGYLMKSGLASVANILVNILQWLAIVVVASSPLWIIAIIIIVVVRRKKKKSRQQAARQHSLDKPSDQPPTTPDATGHQ